MFQGDYSVNVRIYDQDGSDLTAWILRIGSEVALGGRGVRGHNFKDQNTHHFEIYHTVLGIETQVRKHY